MAALQKGDTVLITGGTGWIGSHVVHEALSAGLRVKLAVRSEEKANSLVAAMKKLHKECSIKIVVVADIAQEGAFDDLLDEDAQGVIHTAIDFASASNPKEFISTAVNTTVNILNSIHARKEGIRRFVMTSSSVALGFPNSKDQEKTKYWDASTWNTAVAKLDLENKEYDLFTAYASAKVQSEQALWSFIEEKNPNFTASTILPNSTFGAPVPGIALSSSGQMIVDVAEGRPSLLLDLGPQYHSDVEDVAKLHVLGVTSDTIQNERIIAFTTRYTVKSLIEAIIRVRQDSKVATEMQEKEWSDTQDNTEVDVSRANTLLQDQKGLHDLDFSLRGNLLGVQLGD